MFVGEYESSSFSLSHHQIQGRRVSTDCEDKPGFSQEISNRDLYSQVWGEFQLKLRGSVGIYKCR